MTFLEFIRLYAEVSQQRCDPECSLHLHRQDAMFLTGLCLDNPEVLDGLNEVVERARAIRAGTT